MEFTKQENPLLLSISFSIPMLPFIQRNGIRSIWNSSKQRLLQTLTEKIVQYYAVDLLEGKLVRSGDYITCRPQHCSRQHRTDVNQVQIYGSHEDSQCGADRYLF